MYMVIERCLGRWIQSGLWHGICMATGELFTKGRSRRRRKSSWFSLGYSNFHSGMRMNWKHTNSVNCNFETAQAILILIATIRLIVIVQLIIIYTLWKGRSFMHDHFSVRLLMMITFLVLCSPFKNNLGLNLKMWMSTCMHACPYYYTEIKKWGEDNPMHVCTCMCVQVCAYVYEYTCPYTYTVYLCLLILAKKAVCFKVL